MAEQKCERSIKLFTMLEPGLDYNSQKLGHYLTVSSSLLLTSA